MNTYTKKISLPGSKSVANRILPFSSLISSRTNTIVQLGSFAHCDDTKVMQDCLSQLGVSFLENSGYTQINGEGLFKGLTKETTHLFARQSGTTSRFISGILGLIPSGTQVELDWENEHNKRPILPLLQALRSMGLSIRSHETDNPPLLFTGGIISNNEVVIDGSISSQFLTSLLMMGVFLPHGLKLRIIGDLVSLPYLDMTEKIMEYFHVTIKRNNDNSFISVPPLKEKKLHGEKRLISLDIEGDASALSYISSYIALHGGDIIIENLGSNTVQGDYKYLDILKKYFGVIVEASNSKTKISAPGFDNLPQLPKNLEIDFENMPDVSMTFMSLALFLPGVTKITGLQTLNAKESRRIEAMKSELSKLGGFVISDDKSIDIGELICTSSKKEVEIETYKDHRIAMSFGFIKKYLAKCGININILDPNCVNKTYPTFWNDLQTLENN